uniref:Interleukin-6 n=1 Tax=Mastacembelus armatus TaxID=205130 RepID=A0A3Q3S1L3_9TELE
SASVETHPVTHNAYLLSAVMLGALLMCAPGAPVENATTESLAGETSGEEEGKPPNQLAAVLMSILGVTQQHKQEFQKEFVNMGYETDDYKIASLPAVCPRFNFSKEACRHRLVEGLSKYSALLKHVEREYPNSSILSQVKHKVGPLIQLIKEEMRNSEGVTVLTGSQKEQLLKDLNHHDAFHRKMTAHSILEQFHIFLVEGKRALFNKKAKHRRSAIRSTIAPTHLFYTKF